ncbi:unnamed protein product [Ambrosiozyma monospora]|uniref:Unnamed protein product n=1 Tax=Ambrosiozyma monospora TaxID=43982 RepID=A0A9W6YQS4_AMBMO|nr:unnamed protein product [Ambrosiozyma monospora]
MMSVPLLLLALLLYIGLLALFNIALSGKLFIGFISWFKLHHLKLNLKHAIINIHSIGISFNLSDFFFPKANGFKTPFIDLRFDGISVKLLHQNQSANNSGCHNNKNNNKDHKTSHFGNLFKKVAKTFSYCPISVSVYGLSIQGPGDNTSKQHQQQHFIEVGKINFITDCLLNSITQCSELNCIFELNDFTTSSPDQTFSKALKVKFGFISPYNEHNLTLRNTVLSVHCGDSKFDIPLLKEIFDSLFPKQIEEHNTIEEEEEEDNDKSISLTPTISGSGKTSSVQDNLQHEHEQHKISRILENFEIQSVNVFLDDVNVTTSTLSLSLNNTKAQLEGLDQDKTTTYFSTYRGSLSLDTLELSPATTQQAENTSASLNFINNAFLLDFSEIIKIIESLNQPELLLSCISSDKFLFKSASTINRVRVSTSLDDIETLITNSKVHKKTSSSATSIEQPKLKSTGAPTYAFMKLLHRVRTRFQVIQTTLSLDMGEQLESRYLIEDLVIDSALSDNLSPSLFDLSPELATMKTIKMALRTIQAGLVDTSPGKNVDVDAGVGVDLGYSKSLPSNYRWLSLNNFVVDFQVEYLSNHSWFIDGLTIDLDSVQTRFVDIELFKKLYKIARKYDSVENEDIEANKSTRRKSDEDGSIDDTQATAKKTLLPQFVKSLTFNFHNFKFLSCFKCPIKFYDGVDQSELNKYERGFDLEISDMNAFVDNAPDVQSVLFGVKKTSMRLITDGVKQMVDGSLEEFLQIFKFKMKYTLLNHRLSVAFPIIDVTLSPEIMWSVMFVFNILSSILPKRSRSSSSHKQVTKKNAKPEEKLNVLFSLHLVMLRLKLPSNIDIVFELDSLETFYVPSVNNLLSIKLNALRMYGANPYVPDKWSLILIVSRAKTKIHMSQLLNEGEPKVDLHCQAFRFEIPFEYVFFQSFDNLRGFMKSFDMAKLILANILKIDDDVTNFKVDVIMPSEVLKPMKMPKVNVHTEKFRFCIHDDPFEYELNRNFKLGKLEQRLRLAKLMEFSEYEQGVRATFPEKYPMLRFENGEAILPKGFNRDHALLKLKRHNEVAIATATVNGDSTVPPAHAKFGFVPIKSPLAQELLSEEEEQCIMYLEEVEESIEQPRQRLFANISKSWIDRVKLFDSFHALSSPAGKTSGDSFNDPTVSKAFLAKYPVLSSVGVDPLFAFDLDHMNIVLDEPSFGLTNFADFIHDIGQGVPKDMRYGILVPLNMKIVCQKLKVQIKDYPLPLLMFGGDERDPQDCVQLSGDFVVAEQMYTPEEVRYNFVPFVSQYSDSDCKDSVFACHVSRTMTSIKFFTDMKATVNSYKPSIVSWSHALQPALGYALDCFDVLSKPPVDISPKLGFWDKMPLMMHCKFDFLIKNGLSLFIKSGLSPYNIVGDSTGFGFVWDGETNLKVNTSANSSDLLIVESKAFEIIIPTFESTQLNRLIEQGRDEVRYSVHKKVFKLQSDPVIWKLGFLFERNANNETVYSPGSVKRVRSFKPHWEVTLKNRDCFTDEAEMDGWDSYKGWRSQYIHMAISIESNKAGALNSMHWTPLSFAHFNTWWNTFSNSLGLPIKTGKMFKNKFLDYRKSEKFGGHLFSINYGLLLNSLYLTHVYKHSDDNDANSKVAFTGLKAFVNSFKMDLHQTKKESTVFDKHRQVYKKDWSLHMDKGVVDVQEMDMRILSAVFNETSATGLLAREIGLDNSNSLFSFERKSMNSSSDYSSDSMDSGWLDRDDFIELESPISFSEDPVWKVTPLASTPRIYYVKDSTVASLDYPFDDVEKLTHTCLLETPLNLAGPQIAQHRMRELKEILDARKFDLNSLSSKTEDSSVKKMKQEAENDVNLLTNRLQVLESLKMKFAHGIFPAYNDFINEEHPKATFNDNEIYPSLSRKPTGVTMSKSCLSLVPAKQSTYRNRFSVYRMLLKWSPRVRNKLFKYFDAVSDRRSSVFNMSRKAINLADELYRSQTASNGFVGSQEFSSASSSFSEENFTHEPTCIFEDAGQALNDFDFKLHDTGELDHVTTDDAYLLKFIYPQVCLDNDSNSSVIVASNEIVLRSVSVNSGYNDALDAGQDDFDIAVERRTGIVLSDAFFYVLDRDKVLSNYYKFFNKSSGSNWPPIIPVEMYYSPGSLKEAVVIQGISLGFLMNTPNKLHDLKADECGLKTFKQVIQIFSPEIFITANSKQYNTIYDVVLSMIEYDKTDSQKMKDKVKKFVQFSDSEDFLKMAEVLDDIQTDVRQLLDYKRFLLLPGFSSQSALSKENELTFVNVELEKLFLRLNALVSFMQQTKAKKHNDSYDLRQLSVIVSSVKLELLLDDDTKFVNVQATETYFTTIQNPNGASKNQVLISDFIALDELPDAMYKTIISRLDDSSDAMAFVDWEVFEPVGGISVVGHKNIKLAPLKMEIDYSVAKKIYDFVYPESNLKMKEDAFAGDGMSSSGESELDSTSMFDDVSVYTSDSNSVNNRNGVLDDETSITRSDNGDDDSKERGKISKKLSKMLSRRKKGVSSGTMAMTSTTSVATTSSGSSFGLGTTVKHQGSVDSRMSKTRRCSTKKSSMVKELGVDDNVVQMEKRASLFQMFHLIKIYPIILCITFKGVGALKMINVNNLTINVPEIEYSNTVMSNEEFIADFRVKIIKVVLKHTGAILNSKFKHHNTKGSKEKGSLTARIQQRVPQQKPNLLPPLNRRNNSVSTISSKTIKLQTSSDSNNYFDPDLLGPHSPRSPHLHLHHYRKSSNSTAVAIENEENDAAFSDPSTPIDSTVPSNNTSVLLTDENEKEFFKNADDVEQI